MVVVTFTTEQMLVLKKGILDSFPLPFHVEFCHQAICEYPETQ